MAANKLYVKQRRFWCVLGVNLFEGLGERDLEELSGYSQNLRYKKGEIIYLPGDPATTVYFLKAGRVKLVYIDESGRRLTMAICRPGQPFGELTLSDDREHRLLAEALTDAELCSIAKSALMQFASERPQISLKLTKWVDRQLQEVQVRLEELLFKDVPTRLARVLLRLAEEHGEPTPEGVLIDLPLTHQELAELIGSTRETTSLTLGAFTREGLLTRQRRRFLVHDVAALRQRAE
jgi:CRP/FNR family transcriptional regulator